MEKELNIAIQASKEAGEVIMEYYKADYEIREKGYHNPVTTADHAADSRLKEILVEARPEFGCSQKKLWIRRIVCRRNGFGL